MEKVRTICCDCHSKCGAIVHVEDGKIVKVEGDPNHPVSKGMFCCKGLSAAQIHDDPNRLQYPMKRVGPRGSGKWERISWDEAYGIIMDNMRTITDKYGANAFVISQGTGRQTNHFHFRLNNTYGHPGWGMTPTHVCLMPNLIPTLLTFGFFGFIDAADILNSRCAVLWGVNSFTAWPGTQGRHVLEAKANGTKIIVVDPRFTDLAAKADLWMQLRPGTDLALALALTHVVIAEDLYDHDFVDKWCYGFDELAASVEEYTAEWAEIITGVSAAKIVEMARMIATERPSNVTPSLGASMHENGMQTGRAICNLFAILGDLDAKGGLLSNKFWDYMLADEITLQTPEAGAKMKTLVGYDRKPFLLDMAAVPFPHAMWDAMKSEIGRAHV